MEHIFNSKVQLKNKMTYRYVTSLSAVSDWSYSRGGVRQPGPGLRGPLSHPVPSGLRPTCKIVHSYSERNQTDKFEKRLAKKPFLKLSGL
ncbi:hypothetical protein EVAR_11894_1 [Eumeta japonica]|uniref:Uncharacterized protein n=1 Tax=Eumeta variegata TaxID=151549 RepID=A0A4C1U7U8_EUMVA|nr:hypothetical protein EVAR_11894_1 [Eumeta japonica]